MKLVKKLAAFLLSSVLCVTSSFCAFAASATVSEWATPSEILESNSIIPFSVNGNDAPIFADIRDNSTGAYIGNQKGIYKRMAGGHYVYRWPSLPKGQHYQNVYFVVSGGDLPKPGTYGVSFSMFQENLTIGPSVTGYVSLRSWADNVSVSLNSVKADLVSANGGWTGQATINLGYSNSSVTCMLQWPEMPRDLEVGVPSTPVKFSFKLTDNVPEVSTPDIDSGVSADDALIDINQGISNSVSSIDDSIKELIQTIINQLDALWNQFSGEFTNMFTAWQTHTNAIVAAIQAISTQAGDGIQNIIDNASDNADQISDDIKDAEDNITGGYDNSQITSDNQQLSDSINQYDDAEDDLMDDVNGAIDDVDFNLDLTSFSSIIQTVSGFLQDCYENSGNFKIVINLSLLVSLASCVIGLYRFKGG